LDPGINGDVTAVPAFTKVVCCSLIITLAALGCAILRTPVVGG
jgi:hypothetical protein